MMTVLTSTLVSPSVENLLNIKYDENISYWGVRAPHADDDWPGKSKYVRCKLCRTKGRKDAGIRPSTNEL